MVRKGIVKIEKDKLVARRRKRNRKTGKEEWAERNTTRRRTTIHKT